MYYPEYQHAINRHYRKIQIIGKEGDMTNSLKEALKEGLRVVVLAVIPIAIEGLMNKALNIPLIGITAAIAALRFLDSWLHETKLANKGLTRF